VLLHKCGARARVGWGLGAACACVSASVGRIGADASRSGGCARALYKALRLAPFSTRSLAAADWL
jgi:hypothetical protein